jgi:tRNA modification GTPase
MRRAPDTVFALSTARGRAGIAVIRVSGGQAGSVLQALDVRLPPPRRARVAQLRDLEAGEVLDQALVLWLPGPQSFTGEDMAELHVHGGPAVIAAVLNAVSRVPGCRLAEPGEFSRRAFEHGKLDLAEIEGLADLIAAETAAQRRQALRQLDGALGRTMEIWAVQLLRSLAHVEAAIDFPDEDLPEAALMNTVHVDIDTVAAAMGNALADRGGERVRDGLSIALIGPPNSGKSSLLNCLAGRDAAIVSAVAGTTRDVIEVQLELNGYPVVVADTAGLRESSDPVEGEGIRRARARAAVADLVVLVLDAGDSVSRETMTTLEMADTAITPLIVWNKIDLAAPPAGAIGVSALTGVGIEALVEILCREAGQVFGAEPALVTRQRHRSVLENCAAALDRAVAGIEPALIAEDLRLAVRLLGRITGKVDVEDVLDVIFRDFCIGK